MLDPVVNFTSRLNELIELVDQPLHVRQITLPKLQVVLSYVAQEAYFICSPGNLFGVLVLLLLTAAVICSTNHSVCKISNHYVNDTSKLSSTESFEAKFQFFDSVLFRENENISTNLFHFTKQNFYFFHNYSILWCR